MKNSVVKLGIRVSAFLSLLFANAQAVAGDLSVFADPIDTVLDAIWGPPGQSLAILAIAFLGLSGFFGKISGERAAMIILGIVLVFFAPEIFDAFR